MKTIAAPAELANREQLSELLRDALEESPGLRSGSPGQVGDRGALAGLLMLGSIAQYPSLELGPIAVEPIDLKLILEGNAFLFPYNLHNFFMLHNHRELPGLTGLWGQAVDRALVVFEQTLVQRFIDRFNWPDAKARPSSLKRISKEFYDRVSNDWLKATLRGVLGESFDLGSLDHRIQFGVAAVNRLRTGR